MKRPGLWRDLGVDLPATVAGGELKLAINPGPADNAASAWTYGIDLALENSR